MRSAPYFEEEYRGDRFDFDYSHFDAVELFEEDEEERAEQFCHDNCFIAGHFAPSSLCYFHGLNNNEISETEEAKQARIDREDFQQFLTFVDFYRYGW
jgi:hypothetical protein